jgi:hypothetical protein
MDVVKLKRGPAVATKGESVWTTNVFCGIALMLSSTWGVYLYDKTESCSTAFASLLSYELPCYFVYIQVCYIELLYTRSWCISHALHSRQKQYRVLHYVSPRVRATECIRTHVFMYQPPKIPAELEYHHFHQSPRSPAHKELLKGIPRAPQKPACQTVAPLNPADSRDAAP